MKRSLNTVALGFLVSTVAGAGAWNPSYMKPCVCDTNIAEAIPAYFANRLLPQNEIEFLALEKDLIEGFVADERVPNKSKVIHWAIYELGAGDTVSALEKAATAGVRVVVLTDGKSILAKPGSPRSMPGDRDFLTRDAFQRLTKAGAKFYYNDPEWVPHSSLYSPLMHQKMRIFSILTAPKNMVPLFAYISTHNDTYSETVGDPLSTVSVERLREGHLTAEELAPESKGNVQFSFILRNRAALLNMVKDIDDQIKIYGQGKGRVGQLPVQEPEYFRFQDGSHIKISYSYGSRSGINPNNDQVDFFQNQASNIQRVVMNQFVFSHGKTADALRVVADHKVPIELNVDGQMGFEPWSQAREIAGLFSVDPYRKKNPLIYPWSNESRKTVQVRAYMSGDDKLHLKNTWALLKTTTGDIRIRLFTGSTNLSSNAANNKEISIEIDTDDGRLLKILEEQQEALNREGRLSPFLEKALYRKLGAVARKWESPFDLGQEKNVKAYHSFLESVNLNPLPAFAILGSGAEIGKPTWVDAVSSFYRTVGVGSETSAIRANIQRNLKQAENFRVNHANLDVFLVLTEKTGELDPDVRRSILDLF